MLIEMDDDDYDRIAHLDDGNTSIFSLLSEDNHRSSRPAIVDDMGVKSKLGLLILEGEETYDNKLVRDGEDGDIEPEGVNELSIPDSALLPSDMRSVVSLGASQERSTGRAIVVVGEDDDHHVMPNSYRRSLQTWRMVAAVLMIFVVAIASFGAMKANAWKYEALRLSEDLHQQQKLLSSLLMERDSLLENIKLVEEDLHRAKEWISVYEGMLFTPDTRAYVNDPLLSFKNCYVEATLSLGHCSKELQDWWFKSNYSTNAPSNDEEDGFTSDMAKLVSGVKDSLATTTTQSYNFIESVFTKFSYAGMKETFMKDDYIQSIVKPRASLV
ncbi:hypothetical protein ACHAWU_008202 [Discostella pseudostelligera]|uniref:Uncharacterized protein n=1 Tax=Discostella pseudostelligera TaxID=259834 RepID=A0ABD3MEP6_9STRA